MFPFGFALGVLAGAVAVVVLGPEVAQRARPVAKAALKAALMAIHEAQVRGAEVTEAAEDLYAEAKAEVTADVFAAAMAAGQTKPAAQTAQAKGQERPVAAPRAPTTKAARKRTPVKRSRVMPSANG
jgi:hypothetical protein